MSMEAHEVQGGHQLTVFAGRKSVSHTPRQPRRELRKIGADRVNKCVRMALVSTICACARMGYLLEHYRDRPRAHSRRGWSKHAGCYRKIPIDSMRATEDESRGARTGDGRANVSLSPPGASGRWQGSGRSTGLPVSDFTPAGVAAQASRTAHRRNPRATDLPTFTHFPYTRNRPRLRAHSRICRCSPGTFVADGEWQTVPGPSSCPLILAWASSCQWRCPTSLSPGGWRPRELARAACGEEARQWSRRTIRRRCLERACQVLRRAPCRCLLPTLPGCNLELYSPALWSVHAPLSNVRHTRCAPAPEL